MTGDTPRKGYEPRLRTRLTRYMQFGPYVDFLSKGVYLPSVRVFSDPWEGHVFHSISAKPTSNREALARTINNSKRWIYASCWHAADHESYAMWRIYGQDSGIAIHTEYSRLKELMASIRPGGRAASSLLTTVQYVQPVDGRLPQYDSDRIYSTFFGDPEDVDRDIWRQVMQHCLALKPLAYEYEKEVRLLVLDPAAPRFWDQMIESENDPGIRVELDPSTFLVGVSVSPWAPDWFLDAVALVTAKLGVKGIPVTKSTLYNAPKGDPFK